jgi:hypothetical protein
MLVLLMVRIWSGDFRIGSGDFGEARLPVSNWTQIEENIANIPENRLRRIFRMCTAKWTSLN